MEQTTYEGSIYFSYSQFSVYDRGLGYRACDWTEVHSRQGFAWREQAVVVGTLLEFGQASFRIGFEGPLILSEYQRVIAAHLTIGSGRLVFDGPDEPPDTRQFAVPPGVYRVTIAQRATGEKSEDVDILLERPTGDRRSEILVQDDDLDPPVPLIETAGIPDV